MSEPKTVIRRALGIGALAIVLAGCGGHAEGSLDTTFGKGGTVLTNLGDGGEAVAIQPDGKIVVAYGATPSRPVSPGPVSFALARFTANGSLDKTFGDGGKVRRRSSSSPEDASAVAIQRDGKIVVAGTSARDFDVARYTSNGTPDTSFGTDGTVRTDIGSGSNGEANAVVIQPDGKIVVAGSSDGEFAIARYTRGGELDPSFGTDGKVLTHFQPSSHDAASAVVLEPDGKIVVAGASATRKPHWYGLHSIFALARYTRSGALDTSFGSGGKVLTGFHYSFDSQKYAASTTPSFAEIQPDGKIVIAGTGTGVVAFARYMASGTLDTTFGKGGRALTGFPGNSSADAIAGQPDGKFVVGGSTPNEFLVARYSANGTRDTSFGTRSTVRTGSDEGVFVAFGVAIQPDGRSFWPAPPATWTHPRRYLP